MKLREITEETKVAYDPCGGDIEAIRLQKWAYNQIEIAPEMFALIKSMGKSICDGEIANMIKAGAIKDAECEKGEREITIALFVLTHLQSKFLNKIIEIEHRIEG